MNEEISKRTRGRPKTMSNEKLLTIAMESYWHNDPADVSLNAICQMAGVSKPSVYREFGNEDGLNLATLDHYAELVLARIFNILQNDLPFSEVLQALVAFASNDPQMQTGCLFNKMRAGQHRLGPLTRARVMELDALSQSAFEEFFKTARSRGEWNGQIPIERAATYIKEQLAFAISQRALGLPTKEIRNMMKLAFFALR